MPARPEPLTAEDIDGVSDPIDGELIAALIELCTHLRMREGLPPAALDRVQTALDSARPHWRARGGLFSAPVVSGLMQVSNALVVQLGAYTGPEAADLWGSVTDLQERLEEAVWNPREKDGPERALPGLELGS